MVLKLIINFEKLLGTLLIFSQGGITQLKYIIGLDMEKISGAGFTGMNTKAGDLLTINFRNCWRSPINPQSVPGRVYCALHYDAVPNIRDSGVELLDII